MGRFVITSITEVEVNDDGSMTIVSKETKLEPKQLNQEIIKTRHQVNVSEKRYGILTFGKKDVLGQEIPLDSDIKIFFLNKEYYGHSHKETQGRIDRCRFVCEYFNVCEWFDAEYHTKDKVLYITKN